MAQGGDFTKGDGTGGESIYAQKFNDENFSRQHDSAGLLSMANSGSNTNGSQFFITFRDTPHLNGRHVVFGKLVSGQDVLKLMELVAVDSNDRPRASVTIVDCGQIGQNDADSLEVSANATSSVSNNNSSEQSTSRHSTSADDAAGGDKSREQTPEEPTEQEIDIEQQTAGMSDMEKRLFLIRMRMNKGRKENKAAVDEEYKKNSDPNYEKKQRAAEWNDKKKKWSNDMKHAGLLESESYMLETAEAAGRQMDKAAEKARNAATFGWEAFTAESDYKAYKKRLAKLPTSQASGDLSSTIITTAESGLDPMQYGKIGTDVTTDGLRRIKTDTEDREKQRLKYSRRRNEYDSTAGGINDNNEVFNKKIKRAFDKYTVEIRQNLERGTAL
jgi:hypothetical protein